MASFQPAGNLRSRTFLGLLVAQFLAAFNDQAIHASAMFFAINQQALSEAQAISLMPILFYAPWALFCTLAGYLADRYSKRGSLIFWKFAEVGITAVALLGFWLGTHGQMAGPWIVLSTVFLMGMHSAFFVPAKYGAMPEILQSHMLSRGNGLLESLSFLAIILGTVFGGVLSHEFRHQEYIIGAILFGLAVIGAIASLLIEKMPAANPDRAFPPYLYQPLFANIRALLRSRPLAFSVVGIAFFTFIVAFMRATVYMHGESQVPRWTETQTSLIVGMVALGIGIGSPLVGFLSGGKVELGLVPVGAVGMIIAAFTAALLLHHVPALVVCIIAIGFFTGFYIVPLFTLLQHRAPKASKGDFIATSNFINVTGAIAASLLFFVLVKAAHMTGVAPELVQTDRVREGRLREEPIYAEGRPIKVKLGKRVLKADEEGDQPQIIESTEDERIDTLGAGLKKGDAVIVSKYQIGKTKHYRLRPDGQPMSPVYDNSGLPALLFLGAGLMTLLTLGALKRLLPDLFLRTLLWLRARGRWRLEVVGVDHLPGDGPVLIVTNAANADQCLQLMAATDRTTRCLLVDRDATPSGIPSLTRWLAARRSLAWWNGKPSSADENQRCLQNARRALDRGEAICLPIGHATTGLLNGVEADFARDLDDCPVIPVYCENHSGPDGLPRLLIAFGTPLPAKATEETYFPAIEQVGKDHATNRVPH